MPNAFCNSSEFWQFFADGHLRTSTELMSSSVNMFGTRLDFFVVCRLRCFPSCADSGSISMVVLVPSGLAA